MDRVTYGAFSNSELRSKTECRKITCVNKSFLVDTVHSELYSHSVRTEPGPGLLFQSVPVPVSYRSHWDPYGTGTEKKRSKNLSVPVPVPHVTGPNSYRYINTNYLCNRVITTKNIERVEGLWLALNLHFPMTHFPPIIFLMMSYQS